MDCFAKKIVFKKPGYPELEFEGDRRILPTCVISVKFLVDFRELDYLEILYLVGWVRFSFFKWTMIS